MLPSYVKIWNYTTLKSLTVAQYDYTTDLRVSEKVEKTQWELFNDSNKYSQQLILVSESIPGKMEYLMRTNYSP